MPRILLADDEYYILSGLQKLIADHFPEVEVFAYASGMEALRHLPEVMPDIIISDIRMAELSGLDFIQAVRELLPDVQVFIISGYSDFEYARRAIELKVAQYVLKPIPHERMIHLIQAAIDQLERRSQWIERERLGNAYARQKVAQNLLSTGIYDDQTQLELRLLGLAPLFSRYLVGSLLIREYQMAMPYSESNQLVNLRRLIAELMDKAMQEFGVLQYLYADVVRGSFILIGQCTRGQLESALGSVSRAVFEEFQLYSDFSISAEHTGAEQLFNAYCESAGLGFQGDSQSIFSDDDMEKVRLIHNLKHRIENALSKDTPIQTAAKLKMAFTVLTQQCDNSPIAVSFAGELLMMLSRVFQERSAKEGIAALFPMASMTHLEASSVSQLSDLCDRLERDLQHFHSASVVKRNQDLIEQVKAYIEQNLHDASQEKAAQLASVSAIYLSIVFKEAGENFRDYLIRRKMDRAKQMLAQTDEKVYAIADAVGYNDIKYFSRNFKRLTGLTPQEYRAAQRH